MKTKGWSIYRVYRNFKKPKNKRVSLRKMNFGPTDQNAIPRGSYQKYSLQLKRTAIQRFNKGERITSISRALKISAKNIRRWTIYGADRKQGCGRKCMDSQMEARLYEWCKERMKNVQRLSRKAIRQKALELTKFKQIFKASKGWLDKFVRKYSLIQNQRKSDVKLEIKSEDQ